MITTLKNPRTLVKRMRDEADATGNRLMLEGAHRIEVLEGCLNFIARDAACPAWIKDAINQAVDLNRK